MKSIETQFRRLQARRALVRLCIEAFITSDGGVKLPPEERLIYLLALDATLHGEAMSAARIALISGVARTNVTRRLRRLEGLGLLTSSKGGWRVVESYLSCAEVGERIARLDGIVRRTYPILLSDPDS